MGGGVGEGGGVVIFSIDFIGISLSRKMRCLLVTQKQGLDPSIALLSNDRKVR